MSEAGSDSPQRWVRFEDKTLAAGFTQIPNAVIRNPALSMQAKLMYGLLLSYAWDDPEAYPGLKRMRRDTGAKEDTLRRYVRELVEHNLIDVKRRGQGKTNLYTFKQLSGGSDHPQTGGSRNPSFGGDKKAPTGGDKKDPENKDSVENSPRAAGAAENNAKSLVTKLYDRALEMGLHLDDASLKRHGANLKRLQRDGLSELDLNTVVNRFALRLAEMKPGVKEPSPQQVWRDIQKARQSRENGSYGPSGGTVGGHPQSIYERRENAKDKPNPASWYEAVYQVAAKDVQRGIDRGMSHTEIEEAIKTKRRLVSGAGG